MDKLGAVQVFLAIARTGTYTAAAAELGISKAMASRHVNQLEETLGVRLFNRTTRRLALTEAGAAYRDRMRELVNEIREAEEEIARLGTEPRGTLRLMAPTSFGSFHLTRAIADFCRTWPRVDVNMILAERAPDIIEEGLDLAIRIGRVEDSSVVARRLAEARVVVCGSPDYLEANGTPAHPDNLARHTCLTYSGRQPVGEWTFTIRNDVKSTRVAGKLQCNVGDALRVAAIQGLGLAQLPTYMVGLDIKAGRLAPVLEEFEPPKRPIHALYMHRRYLSAKVRTFIDFLMESYYPVPYWERWTD